MIFDIRWLNTDYQNVKFPKMLQNLAFLFHLLVSTSTTATFMFGPTYIIDFYLFLYL